MKRNLVISAAVICFVSVSIAKADLILTLDGQNITGFPFMTDGTGPYQIAIDGNTTFEPNDIRFETVGGTLTVISDVNHQYSFQYESGSTAGLIWLVSNTELTIDEISMPVDTTIYEIFIFSNPDINLTGACGSDLYFFLPPEEEEGGEGDSMTEQPTESTDESTEQNQSEMQNQPENTSPPLSLEEESESYTMTFDGGESLMMESANPEIPYYVQDCIEWVRDFKEGGSGEGIIIINEVNESFIFDNQAIYYVPNPPLIIEGNDVRAYIPSDTIIVIEQEPDSNSIVVNNGAKIITGTSNGQNDYLSVLPPVWIVSIDNIPFEHNYRGIIIEQTAGSDQWINNIFINNCSIAIETRPLDYPISNVYADHCYKGIVYHGSGTVSNNQIINFGKITDGIFPYEGRGIEFFPTSIDGNQIYTESYYEAYFNLVHNGDVGITARRQGFLARLVAYNNAVTKCSRFAYDRTSGTAYSFNNCGFWDNAADSNGTMTFINSVHEVNNPFVFITGDYRAYLDQNSMFVNRGLDYSYDSDQPGWSAFVDGSPDSNKADIWIHHQTRKYTATADLNSDGIVDDYDIYELLEYWLASYSISDIDGDGRIDIYDLQIIILNWLEQGTNLADLNLDNQVNFMDLAILGSKWNAKDPMYADLNGDRIVNFTDYTIVTGAVGQTMPTLSITDINGENVDYENINGQVFVDFSSYGGEIYSLALYLDNLLLEQYVAVNRYPVELPSYKFANGRHKLQLVSYDSLNNATIHKPVAVDFNNMVYCLDVKDSFHSTQNFPLSGFTDMSTINISIIAENNDILWSQDFNGPNSIEANIPGSTFNGQETCAITIDSVLGTSSLFSPFKEFIPEDYPISDVSYKMAIILPDPNLYKVRKKAVKACIDACQRKGIKYITLYHHDVNQGNLENVLRDRQFIKYVYWVGHGNDYADANRTIQRTNLLIWDNSDGKWKRRNAYSFTQQSWPNDPRLPRNEDNDGLDLYRFWMSGTQGFTQFRKRLVFIDCCLSGSYIDMAWIFGAYSDPSCTQQYHDQIYIGWRIPWEQGGEGNILDVFYRTTEGCRLFWEDMGIGAHDGGQTVKQAFEYVQRLGLDVRTDMFGANGSIDIDEPIDNIDRDQWLWLGCDNGHGLQAAQTVKLTNP